uniref:Uncharacterized protein n=1 Tax=Nelumbo nucifera TaxID=4432 RepID=A0A822XUG7_NELNU|nr:TPA_asm: hypothetical protein HUJ06_025095 [Nelumbo nucifera]
MEGIKLLDMYLALFSYAKRVRVAPPMALNLNKVAWSTFNLLTEEEFGYVKLGFLLKQMVFCQFCQRIDD